ncbi:MAG: ATP-binding protein, partial [Myxococcota bacterium]
TVRKEYEDDLHRARLEAERSNVEKSQFLANMSHELRTPMAGVLGMLDAILDEPLPETTAFHAGVARECATGLLAILNDILDYSKLEANEVHLERLDYSPQRLLDGVLSMFAARAKEKGLRLDVALDAAVPDWVVGDPTRIRQILVNLVGNAVKFTPTGGVRIEVVRIEEETIFRVADTGIGLSLDQQQRLFQRFAQADASTTRRFGGTGLGLAISKQLAELMGGAIGVDSVEGEGSTFWFTVPSPEGTPVEGEGTLARSPSEDLAGLHVLAAEDNRVNQMVLERVLVKRGHEVTLVEDGEAALRAVAKGRFDVVLMDIQMPVMDGLEATRKIRDLPEGERVPIVALTANAMAGDRERYLEAGMDDYASKPLDAERLASAMARAIAKRRRGLEL